MGGSSSKVGRTLPTKAKSSGSGGHGPGWEAARPTSRPRPIAKEARDQDIQRDGKDPHLLANLSRIGQVDIQSAAATTRTASRVSEIYRKRDLAEQQAASARPVRNCLGATSLSRLLDDRKFVVSRADLQQLAARYTIDVSVLESLVRFVNTPGIGEGTIVRTVGDDGQEKITMQVVWNEPLL